MRMDIERVFAAQVLGAESQATVSQQWGHRELRFRVAENGSVVDVSHSEKSLIQLTRSVRRSTK